MKEQLENILTETKLAYKQTILKDDKITENHLLNIMANTKLLLYKLETVKIQTKKQKPTKELEDTEVEKVKRKLPLWLKRQNQYNYKILKTFMNLSNNNKHTISTRLLEIHCNLEPKIFLSNYNLLKTISQKNHGKIFNEKDGQISLWEPVEEIVLHYFR